MTYRDDVLFARTAIREGEYEEGLEILRATARKYPVPFVWGNLRALPGSLLSPAYWRGLFAVIRKGR